MKAKKKFDGENGPIFYSLSHPDEPWDAASEDEEIASQEAALLGKPVLKSKALRWYMPIIGEVPLMFYVPEINGERAEDLTGVRQLIEEHGGLVVDQHECFTYQIKPK